MCLFPHIITRPSSDFRQFQDYPSNWSTRQRLIFSHNIQKYSKNFLKSQVPYQTDQVVVPCGKCVQCLQSRQNDIAFRAANEADKYGSMHLLTLTYKNSMLPIACTLFRVNEDTGEYFVSDFATPKIIRRIELRRDRILQKSNLPYIRNHEAIVRSALEDIEASPSPRYFYEDSPFGCDLPGFVYKYRYTPSLCRKDVRLWIKSCRVAYERKYGFKLPEFSYLISGEMGPLTARPHYHLCFFGLSTEQLTFMAERWSTQYGFYNLKQVAAVNKDGTSGFNICARYVSKYVTKGTFECSSVTEGFAEKPRLCISKGFGYRLTPGLVDYFRCYDLFGRYDINSLMLDSGKLLSSHQLSSLTNEIRKRSHVTLASEFNYRLPQSVINKLWYYYDYDQDGEKVLRASTIRRIMSDSVRANFMDQYFRKLKSFFKQASLSKDSSFLSRKDLFCSSLAFIEEQRGRQALCSFYSNSIF